MRLFVQPEDGLAPILEAVRAATQSIEIVIFRFDRKELEVALGEAVARGVAVKAVIAHTNHAGEELLRKLEHRLLAAGVTVARTGDDFVRYHSKFMIIDHSELFVLAFNFTAIDIERSRSFGIATKDKQIVREALRLFEADSKRQPYQDGIDNLVVSPTNARQQLSDFINGATRELLIYDVALSDAGIVKLLEQRAKAGVEIRIIGGVKSRFLQRRVLPMRLHSRTIIRDRESAFIGSQSLRKAELETRRELGLIFKDSAAVATMCGKFDEDWEQAAPAPSSLDQSPGGLESTEPSNAGKVAKKTAKAVIRGLPAVAPMVDDILKEVAPGSTHLEIDPDDLQEAIEDAVKSAVKVAVKAAVIAAELAETAPTD